MTSVPASIARAPTLLGLDHLVLRVVDLQAMLRFYVGVLGCTVERRVDELGLVQLRAGASLIDLLPLDGALGRAGGAGPGAEGHNVDHFCLRVEPFDEMALRRRLAEAGIAVGAAGRRYGADGQGPSVYVRDPQGNTVELKGPPEPAPAPQRAPGEAGGECLCGAVRFSAALPSEWVAHCHCSQCRRAHGAAFVTWVGVRDERARIDDPHHQLRWHASSAQAERGFCGRCGSPMFFRSSRWPGELHIARALFTTAIDREPQQHAYHDTHVDWVQLGDTLPRKPAPPDAA